MPSFKLSISYNQVSFFLAKLKNPFNDWAPAHVSQGFAWRKDATSFATIEDGKKEINLTISKEFQINKLAIRAISVPFNIPDNETIEIASISDSIQLDIPSGKYQLVFQILKQGKKLSYDFTLIENGNMEAEILKADALLKPKLPLLMKAKSA